VGFADHRFPCGLAAAVRQPAVAPRHGDAEGLADTDTIRFDIFLC